MSPRLILPVCILCACTPSIDTELASSPSCEVLESTVLTNANSVPEGMSLSLNEVLDQTGGSFEGTLTLADSRAELVFLSMTEPGDATLVRYEATYPEGETTAIAIECPDLITVPYTMALSADPVDAPLLDERWDVEVQVAPNGQITMRPERPLEDVIGSARPTRFDPSEMAYTNLSVVAEVSTQGWTGSIDFVAESEPSGDGPDATVSFLVDNWATFIVNGR